jgi:hypothetical protein
MSQPTSPSFDSSGHRWIDCSDCSVRPGFVEPPPAPRKMKRSPSEEKDFNYFPVRELFGDVPPYQTVDIDSNNPPKDEKKKAESKRDYTVEEIESLVEYTKKTPSHDNIDMALAAITKFTDKNGSEEPSIAKMEKEVRNILLMWAVV